MITGKVWGDSTLVTRNAAMEMHHIRFLSGSVCSRHYHKGKWNGFYVLKGRLAVAVWRETGLVEKTALGPGDYFEVAPGLVHQFQGVTDGEALEVYWADALNWDDIVRLPTEDDANE